MLITVTEFSTHIRAMASLADLLKELDAQPGPGGHRGQRPDHLEE